MTELPTLVEIERALVLKERVTYPEKQRHYRDARTEVLTFVHPPSGITVRMELPRRPLKAFHAALRGARSIAAGTVRRDLEKQQQPQLDAVGLDEAVRELVESGHATIAPEQSPTPKEVRVGTTDQDAAARDPKDWQCAHRDPDGEPDCAQRLTTIVSVMPDLSAANGDCPLHGRVWAHRAGDVQLPEGDVQGG